MKPDGSMDAYDEIVEALKKTPDSEFRQRAFSAWNEPWAFPEGILFGFCEPNRFDYGSPCGCLTMVKEGTRRAATLELTLEIRADDRLPKFDSGITKENLHVFAEWQRRMDRDLGRKPPVLRDRC